MQADMYKFVASIEAVEEIARGRIKFTKFDDLNDPNELLPSINRQAVIESRLKLLKFGFTDHQYEWLACQGELLKCLAPHMQAIPVPPTKAAATKQLKQPFYDNIDVIERLHGETVRFIRERVGVLSLTSAFNSFPLWAHYAAGATGFVVIFRDLNLAFPGDATSTLQQLKPVEYVEQYTGMTFDPVTLDRPFFSKHRDWSYEQEWRVVMALDSCERVSPKLHLKHIDLKHVAGIVCGWRTSQSDRERARAIVSKNALQAVVSITSVEDGKITVTAIAE